jgi:hypothetical protein
MRPLAVKIRVETLGVDLITRVPVPILLAAWGLYTVKAIVAVA